MSQQSNQAGTPGELAVFTDSLEALQTAYRDGLPRSARVLTSSPTILREPELNCEEIDSRLTGEGLRALIGRINTVTRDLYDNAKADPELAPFAITIARAFNRNQTLLRKAACLEPEDLTRRRLTLRFDCGDDTLNRLLNPPWDRLIARNGKAEVRSTEIAVPEFGRSLGGDRAGVLDRVRIVGLKRALYPAILSIWRLLPATWGRGDIVILKDNELIKDAALAFAARGYRVSRAMLPTTLRRAELPDGLAARIHRHVGEEVRRAFTDWVLPDPLATIIDEIEDNIRALAGEQLAAIEYWKIWFDARPTGRRCAILCNAPNGAIIAGLAVVARQRKVPLIAFQHGIRREIADTPIDMQINIENVVADLLITFSDRGAEVSNTSPYRHGVSLAAGLPGDYYRTASRRRCGKAPILYVSTTLYLGNVQLLTATASDNLRARREVELIDRVFAAIPERVTYKPYPAIRYPDPDPIIVAARSCANVELFEGEIDLRYMLGEHRLLVTSGATSTVGWCALSGLPIVMIDWPDVQPLERAMRARFEEAFFLFDGGAPDLFDALREFLSRPIDEIERLATEKAAARAALLSEVFGAWGSGAGRRAVNAIERQFFETRETVQPKACHTTL